MQRWLLAGLLYADGMTKEQVACVMSISVWGASSLIRDCLGHMLGRAGYVSRPGRGNGTKLELRLAFEEAGWLS